MKKSYLIVLIIAITLAAALIIVPLVIDGLSHATPETPETPETPDAPEIPDTSDYADRDVTGRNIAYVTMKIKDYGDVKLLLDATSAPRTVANFLTLAKSGFYDGIAFCEAMPLYSNASIILGGDPGPNEREPAPDTVKGEFSSNGIENDLKLKRGTISMIYPGTDPDSASSVFFFSSGDLSSIYDGVFATFGYVVSGYKVIDQIINVGIDNTGFTGLIHADHRPVITSITVDQDIDYSLVSDVYVHPLTEEEISSLLGAENEAKRTPILTSNDLVYRAYVDGDDNLLQLFGKIGDKTANILLSVSKEGKILGTKALAPTEESLAAGLSALVGLGLSEIGETELPDDLKTAVKDALRNVAATHADGSASNHFYLRDTEGREIYTVEMKIKGYDTPIVILLDKTTAPITVEHFISLVEKGFYDGLDFHRIIKGFMIQGGESKSEKVDSIKGEFASNGHTNDILHLRGTISMARTSVKDSATSQFFICDADAPHLDGDYAAFGYVISGMATVDAIADYAVGKTDSNGNLNAGVDKPTIEYVKIIEN